MFKTKKERVYLVLILLLLAGIAGVVLFAVSRGASPKTVPLTPRPTAKVVIKEVEKMVEIEKEITPEIIEDGLRDIGFLVTEEYYFTEVVSFSSIKKLFKTDIDLKFTESSYLASYDGSVTAGIDFDKVSVSRDEGNKILTVSVPKAEIQKVFIDPESFELYSEKIGIGNPISVEDFNMSLVELERSAKDKAIDRGLLQRADEHAEAVIRNFVVSLTGTDGYRLEIVGS